MDKTDKQKKTKVASARSVRASRLGAAAAIGLAFSFLAVVILKAAWTEPALPPPDGNPAPPIYSTGANQTLDGSLIVGINDTAPVGLSSRGVIGISGVGTTIGVQASSTNTALFGNLSIGGAGGERAVYGLAVDVNDYALYSSGGLGIGLGSGDIWFTGRDRGISWPRASDNAALYGVSVTTGGELRLFGHGAGIKFMNQDSAPLLTISEAGVLSADNIITLTSADPNRRRITNLGAPIDGSDAATKSYVDAAAGSGGGYKCFLSLGKFTGNLGGKSGADAKCAGEESGFSFGTNNQFYSRATGGAPITAFSYGGANTCSSWGSTSGNGDAIAWDETNARWSDSTAACSSSNSLLCCNFNSSGVTAPSSLAGTPYRELKADLTWVDNSSNETGFKVYRGSTAGFASFDAGFPVTVAANSSAYRSDQPSASLKYYRVTAYNAGGESNASGEVSVTTPAGVIAASNLNWIRQASLCCSNGQIYYQGKLTWNDSSDIEADYRLMRCIGATLSACQNTTDYQQLGLPYGANSSSISGEERYAADGSYYFYRIKASTPGTPATDGWSGRIMPVGGNGWMYAF